MEDVKVLILQTLPVENEKQTVLHIESLTKR